MSAPEPDYPDAEDREIRQPSAVGWFGVRQLFGTGLNALVTAVIGTRSARREVLAALDDAEAGGYFDFSESDELWIDYVADLGDGFDATEAVAWLVGRDHVFIGDPGETVAQPTPPDMFAESPAEGGPGKRALPAGGVLIFGGDETYPVASQWNYSNRTIGPYYAARPWGDRDPKKGGRALFAIPGNHDWYDGLGAFVRCFCQPGRWAGCWQAQQTRSYFALKLPHGFWLWGVDLATEDDIDPPQLAYFTRLAALMQPEDQLVLCVPEPAWLARDGATQAEDGKPPESWEAWSKLDHIVSLATRRGIAAPLLISGDLHHYCHYRSDEPEPRHYVTCGGGGAFTLGTAGTPETLRFADGATAARGVAYPSKDVSEALRNGVWKLVFRHKAFCATLSALMLGLVWALNTTSLSLSTSAEGARVIDGPLVGGLVEGHGVLRMLRDLAAVLIYSPSSVIVTALVAVCFVAFARAGASAKTKPWAPFAAGGLHFLVQVAAAFAIAAAASRLLQGSPTVLAALATIVGGVAAGWFIHGFLMAAYLWLSNRLVDAHELELYSSQAIEDWKSFLRIRVDAGGLTVFPIGLAKVPRWVPAPFRPGGKPQKPEKDMMKVPRGATHLFDPKEPIAIELIGKPIEIRARGTRA